MDIFEFKIRDDRDGWENTPIFARVDVSLMAHDTATQNWVATRLARFLTTWPAVTVVRWNREGSLQGHYVSQGAF